MTDFVPQPIPPIPAKGQEELVAREELMSRKGGAFERLNMRIARLAIALGLELDTDAGLNLALESDLALEPHQRVFRDELRGLLTLRYQMETQLVDEIGSSNMHTLVSEVEKHMDRVGFRHGVDGIHEDQLFPNVSRTT